MTAKKKANSEPNDWCVQNTVNARGDKGTKKWVVQNRSFTLGHRAWPHALQNNTNTKMGAQFTSTGVGTWPQVTSTRVGTYNFLIKYVSRDRKCVSKDNQVTIACIPQKAIDELHCANWVHFRALSTISNPLNYTADTNWCLAAKQWTTKRSKVNMVTFVWGRITGSLFYNVIVLYWTPSRDANRIRRLLS